MKIISRTHNEIKNFFRNNILVVSFIVMAVLMSLIMRYYVTGDISSLKAIISDTGIVIFIGSIGYFFGNKIHVYYLYFWSFILSFVLIANIIHYRYYSAPISFTILTQISLLDDVSDSILLSTRIYDLLYLLFPIFLISLTRKLKKTGYIQKKVRKKVKSRDITFTMFISFILLVLFGISLTTTETTRLYKQWNRHFLVDRLGLYTYQISDLIVTLSHKLKPTIKLDEAIQKFNNYFLDKDGNERPWQTNEYTNILKDKDVYFIHFESMQSILIDLEINDQAVTPNLSKLAHEGLYFSNFYAQDSSGTSSDSEFTLLNSILPLSSGSVFNLYSGNRYMALPSLLKEKQYYTASFHGNVGSFWNRINMHRALGYNIMYDRKYYQYLDEDVKGFGINDKLFFEQSVEHIKSIHLEEEKVMGTLITLTNHTPWYDVYDEFDTDYLGESRIGRYIDASNYADSALGVFLEKMDENDMLDDAVIVIYGDHDAKHKAKTYNKLFNYSPELERNKKSGEEGYIDVYDTVFLQQLKRVPFIIWTKDNTIEPKEIELPMGMIDVYPTIANMLGVYSPFNLGNDVFTIEKNMVVFPDESWIDETTYYSASRAEYHQISELPIVSYSVESNNAYSETLIDLSNLMIRHDLLKVYYSNKRLMIDLSP
ncbi:LTA synthase family protein [Mycoplasmatota bacterium zrk1]